MITTRHFPCATVSVPQARHFIADSLTHIPAESLEAVLVIVSELVTNSVRHAKTEFDVAIDQSEQNLRITVTDTGTGSPEVRWPPVTRPTGRGLQIVEELADAWGVNPLPNQGKQVWFTLQLSKSPHVSR